MKLKILYRGSLVSCNYACSYCPFAKRRESRAEMERDQLEVERFVAWVTARSKRDRLGILFTPWGEALVRPWYQEALAELSRLEQVERVAIQTNLSAPLAWTAECDTEVLALWATYHPTQVTRAKFLRQCSELDRRGVRYSVGVVGLREQFEDLAALRAELDPGVYLWINAYKREPDYYAAADLTFLEGIDPLFATNNRYHATRGQPCRAGSGAITVDGAGTMRRCHFIREPLGSIYEAGFEDALQPSSCTNDQCGCFIGYVHFEPLGLYETFGAGVLERIPRRLPVRSGTSSASCSRRTSRT